MDTTDMITTMTKVTSWEQDDAQSLLKSMFAPGQATHLGVLMVTSTAPHRPG